MRSNGFPGIVSSLALTALMSISALAQGPSSQEFSPTPQVQAAIAAPQASGPIATSQGVAPAAQTYLKTVCETQLVPVERVVPRRTFKPVTEQVTVCRPETTYVDVPSIACVPETTLHEQQRCVTELVPITVTVMKKRVDVQYIPVQKIVPKPEPYTVQVPVTVNRTVFEDVPVTVARKVPVYSHPHGCHGHKGCSHVSYVTQCETVMKKVPRTICETKIVTRTKFRMVPTPTTIKVPKLSHRVEPVEVVRMVPKPVIKTVRVPVTRLVQKQVVKKKPITRMVTRTVPKVRMVPQVEMVTETKFVPQVVTRQIPVTVPAPISPVVTPQAGPSIQTP